MHKPTRVEIKKWDQLTKEEVNQLNNSHFREWQISDMSVNHHGNNIFFLLKDEHDTILAQGQLVPIDRVLFDEEIFNIFGIGGVIANIKGQGYGRKILQSIKDYLVSHHKTGVGFTGFSGFYEKCGFSISTGAIKRFVFTNETEEIINKESDRVCFLDSKDQFMKKVLENPNKKVYLPRTPNW